MNDSTLPKTRKPFRARRPRRPVDPNAQSLPADNLPVGEAARSDAPEPAADGSAGAPAVTASEPAAAGPEGQPRAPRPPRPQGPRRHGRSPGQGGHSGPPGPQDQQGGQRGGRPRRPPRDAGAEGGEVRGPIDPDAQPRFNDNPPRQFDPNRGQGPGERKGKGRYDRGQGGQGGQWGRGGAGGQGRPGRSGQGGQQAWEGKQNSTPYGGGGGPDRGNEIRRSRAISQQHQEPVRLSTLMSDRGLCSLREADAYIARGWVIVNGERVSSLGLRVHPAAEIRLAPEARGEQSRRVTILLNKPVDCIAEESADAAANDADSGFVRASTLIAPTTLDDRYDGPTFDPSHLQDLRVAGSLDVDAMGLLVLTQDEHVLRQLGGGDATIETEYLVDVDGTPGDEALQLLGQGVEIDGATLKPVRVGRHGDNQLKVVLTGGQESLYRFCERAGLNVTGVKCVRIGQVRLGDVPQGKWRYLRDDENF